MQKIGILNSEIAKVLADMGHTDTIVIGDCGLPVPDGVKKIDLALKLGTPRFLEVVEELAKYMEVEKIHVAAEMQSKNEECWQQMHKLLTAISPYLPVRAAAKQECLLNVSSIFLPRV